MASDYGDPSDEDEEIQVFVRKETGGGDYNLVVVMKLDGVGPVDDRPSTD